MNNRFRFRGVHPVLAEIQEIKFIDFIHNTVDFGDGDIFDIDDVKIQQCTGLKDKNGTLIYEGDIVDKGTLCKWIVTWFKNRFILVPDFEYKNRDKCANDRKCGFQYFENNHSYADRSNEVIGNIYDNPELLKDEVER